MMNSRLKGFYGRFFVDGVDFMVKKVLQVMGVTIEDETVNAVSDYPTAVITDDVRVLMIREQFERFGFFYHPLWKEVQNVILFVDVGRQHPWSLGEFDVWRWPRWINVFFGNWH